jgi:hypothetical protein
MIDESHDIPAHLIPSDETVIADGPDEEQVNEELETERWVYVDEPAGDACPYCGKAYDGVTYASRVKRAVGRVCPYPVEEVGDFITKFHHGVKFSTVEGWANGERDERLTKTVQSFCSPEYADTLVSGRMIPSKDYDLTNA